MIYISYKLFIVNKNKFDRRLVANLTTILLSIITIMPFWYVLGLIDPISIGMAGLLSKID